MSRIPYVRPDAHVPPDAPPACLQALAAEALQALGHFARRATSAMQQAHAELQLESAPPTGAPAAEIAIEIVNKTASLLSMVAEAGRSATAGRRRLIQQIEGPFT